MHLAESMIERSAIGRLGVIGAPERGRRWSRMSSRTPGSFNKHGVWARRD